MLSGINDKPKSKCPPLLSWDIYAGYLHRILNQPNDEQLKEENNSEKH